MVTTSWPCGTLQNKREACEMAGEPRMRWRAEPSQWLLEQITDGGVLDLSGQDLGGEIPSWVYRLTDLRVLWLNGCGSMAED